jgi:hypothetical protein
MGDLRCGEGEVEGQKIQESDADRRVAAEDNTRTIGRREALCPCRVCNSYDHTEQAPTQTPP